MKSPIYPDTEMKRIVKFGIEIEYCPRSGGVWLDKGELEKLLEYVELRSKDIDNFEDMSPQIEDDYPQKSRHNEDYSKNRNYNNQYKKRESILGEIFDIF